MFAKSVPRYSRNLASHDGHVRLMPGMVRIGSSTSRGLVSQPVLPAVESSELSMQDFELI